MTTLLQAAQALLTAAKQSVEWCDTRTGRLPGQLMMWEIEALEQAIAQEQAKQTPSGTSERSCSTCKYEKYPRHTGESPCLDCKEYLYFCESNWEPKP